ncbi:hypothetical protein DL546_005440 [Coniochaeta pulveracea]|uniref:Glycosyl transferase CAP10 domain-containing protein n=1 Tax=Coniochaeta pulveracea TaxID=177199 RepID=A0A420Y5U8_9PEZI|nr:hypothetical protein DL546_005440 [Coniochaeta pulveracea]
MGFAESFNMRSPSFPPRRPSALLRYLVPAFLLLLVFYYLSGSTQDVSFPQPDTPFSPPAHQDGSAFSSEPKKEASKPSKDDMYPGKDTAYQGGKTAEEKPIEEDSGKSTTDGKKGESLDDLKKATTTTTRDHAQTPTPTPGAKPPVAAATHDHPIDTLIAKAEKDFDALLASESKTLADAAAAYRKRRGRHPPPGFDDWFKFAKDHNAVVVEDFWDQVYHDLEPFWALPAAQIRKDAWDFEMTINVRDHKATAGSEWFWTQIWLNLTQTIEHLLPDMDIALNAMDEPRLVVPWEDIDGYMTEAHKTRRLVDVSEVVSEFQKLPAPGQGPDKEGKPTEKNWEDTRPFWKVVSRGCPPTSLVRKGDMMTDFDHVPYISRHLAAPHSYKGYVSNYTLSTEMCHQPDMQGLNGIFVEPLTVRSTKTLFPMFGGSKLAVNNEILLPAPMYWNEEERFTGGEDHGNPWSEKKDGAIWRGVATGGRNRENTWRAFQRHRFVAMNNGTKLALAQNWTALPANFELPGNEYDVAAQREGKLGDWVGSWSDMGFVDLFCSPEPPEGEPRVSCNYTGSHFSIVAGMKMKEQFPYKYLPDIDGNSFSGRYLGFLRSTSLPVKATLWREWHDSRLVAWKHFVPMDNRYSDWFGIMQYFLGYKGEAETVPAHDEAAERIASAGKEWAEKVLRKEDMQVYVLRLLLEYARISDDNRERMGWVGDLVPEVLEKDS